MDCLRDKKAVEVSDRVGALTGDDEGSRKLPGEGGELSWCDTAIPHRTLTTIIHAALGMLSVVRRMLF